MTAESTARRTRQRLKWNIKREWVTNKARQHTLYLSGE
jgi:hypothetical protein